MKPFAKFFVGATISLAMLSTGCAQMNGGSTAGAGSPTPTTSTGTVGAVNTGPDRISQGSQSDSLAACLARIPSKATPGQRMFAERTCQRDADNRSSILAVPGQ